MTPEHTPTLAEYMNGAFGLYLLWLLICAIGRRIRKLRQKLLKHESPESGAVGDGGPTYACVPTGEDGLLEGVRNTPPRE